MYLRQWRTLLSANFSHVNFIGECISLCRARALFTSATISMAYEGQFPKTSCPIASFMGSHKFSSEMWSHSSCLVSIFNHLLQWRWMQIDANLEQSQVLLTTTHSVIVLQHTMLPKQLFSKSTLGRMVSTSHRKCRKMSMLSVPWEERLEQASVEDYEHFRLFVYSANQREIDCREAKR